MILKSVLALIPLLAVVGVSCQDYKEYEDYWYAYEDDVTPYGVAVAAGVQPLIINGTRAVQGQVPYQALLVEVDELLCGGSLVSTRHVITAAHCVIGRTTDLEVRVGTLLRSAITGTYLQSFLVPVADITVHPEYNADNNMNDIAILRLPTEATRNVQVNPIRLPAHRQRRPVSFKSRIGRISGWGLTSTFGNNALPGEDLMFADVKIASNARCRALVRRENHRYNSTDRRYGRRYQLFNHQQLCTTGKSRAGVCFGDSGGPLAVTEKKDGVPTLVGIISFLYGESCESAVYGYTFVGAYLDWISGITGIPIRRRYHGRW